MSFEFRGTPRGRGSDDHPDEVSEGDVFAAVLRGDRGYALSRGPHGVNGRAVISFHTRSGVCPSSRDITAGNVPNGVQ